MKLFPAIDLYDGKAVRLTRGEYHQMTVYSDRPVEKALEFRSQGAEFLHVVDLEGARDGVGKNFGAAAQLARLPGLKAELGGGVRDEEAVKRALDAGFFRVILGTSAMENPDFLADMVAKYGEKIAVGVDVRDGLVAVRGWMKTSGVQCFDFISRLETLGVRTVMCTDISKDGALRGPNLELYKTLTAKFDLNVIASGGVSALPDVLALRQTGVYGAIIGRALYTGGLDLRKAIEAAL